MEYPFTTWKKSLTCLLLLLLAGPAAANLTVNMPIGVTEISHKIYHLHMVIFWICVAIGIVVFGLMFYALIFHRKSTGRQADTFHEHPRLEILWSIIPFVILVAMAIPATKTLLEMDDINDADMTIKVTGYMWRWHYEYVGQNIEFMSSLATTDEQIKGRDQRGEHYLREVDQPLVLPINKKIRILTTGNDVIHSWWVPELAVKKDAIPGFINETWTRIDKVGTYRGQCAELCGARHGFMPIVVEAVSEADFNTWLVKQQQAQQQAEQPPAPEAAPPVQPAAPTTQPVSAPAATPPAAPQEKH